MKRLPTAPLEGLETAEDFRKRLGTTIRALRLGKKMEIEPFADLIGVARHTIYRLEAGEGPLDVYQLLLISQVLNAPLSLFLPV